MISKQKSGDSSTNLQAGKDIVVHNNYYTIVVNSIEELAKKLQDSAFGELPDDTKKQIENNQRSYFQALSESLKNLIKPYEELKEIINSPDFQYISKTAAISASRSPSIELHKNLSSLIIQRINNDKQDLKRIVYNEAISIIDKLTIDQLKILTLCFVITKTKTKVSFDNGRQMDFFEFKRQLENRIKPFISFKNTTTEFEHLFYTGCARINNTVYCDIVENIWKNDHPSLFTDRERLNSDKTVTKLVSVWENSQLPQMFLTPVGIALAITFYERITGNMLHIDNWIK